jgi:ribose transport system ATP-binding protein
MAFLPADRKADGGIMSLSAQENLTLPTLGQFWSGLRLRRKSELAETTRWFRSLQVRPAAGARSLLSVFSGGNQQKILFGKWIRQAPRAFLLNEPTQGVDVGAKAELHKLLLELAGTGTAVIISSTDIEELAALCHRILILHDGRIAGELVGSEITPNAIARRVMPAVQD